MDTCTEVICLRECLYKGTVSLPKELYAGAVDFAKQADGMEYTLSIGIVAFMVTVEITLGDEMNQFWLSILVVMMLCPMVSMAKHEDGDTTVDSAAVFVDQTASVFIAELCEACDADNSVSNSCPVACSSEPTQVEKLAYSIGNCLLADCPPGCGIHPACKPKN